MLSIRKDLLAVLASFVTSVNDLCIMKILGTCGHEAKDQVTRPGPRTVSVSSLPGSLPGLPGAAAPVFSLPPVVTNSRDTCMNCHQGSSRARTCP